MVVVVGSDFLCSNKALKNRSVGALNSGIVWKLSSVSVCSRVVWGSGVGAFLHRCSRLKGSKGVGSCTLGSPTKLQDSGSSSESFLVGGRNGPRFHAVMVFLQFLHPEMEQGFVGSKTCATTCSTFIVKVGPVVHSCSFP